MSKLIEKFQEFSTIEHQRINHVRKYINLPCQTHLQAVAKLGDIEKSFCNNVAKVVEELTDASRPKKE